MSYYIGIRSIKEINKERLERALERALKFKTEYGDDDFDDNTYAVFFASDPNLKTLHNLCREQSIKYLLIPNRASAIKSDLEYNMVELDAFKLLRSKSNSPRNMFMDLSPHDIKLFEKNIDTCLDLGDLEGSERSRSFKKRLSQKMVLVDCSND